MSASGFESYDLKRNNKLSATAVYYIQLLQLLIVYFVVFNRLFSIIYLWLSQRRTLPVSEIFYVGNRWSQQPRFQIPVSSFISIYYNKLFSMFLFKARGNFWSRNALQIPRTLDTAYSSEEGL